MSAFAKTTFRFCVAVFLLAALSPLGRSQPTSTVLDFEGIADSTVLTSQIAGVNFTNAIVLTSGVSLNEFEFPPHSGINVLSDNGGPMSIGFVTPVTSIAGYFTYSSAVTVQAFDINSHLVATATSQFGNNEAISGIGGSAPNELITVAFAGGISRVTITGAPGGASFALDDFTITPPIVVPINSTPPSPLNPPLTITNLLTIPTVPLGSPVSFLLTANWGIPPYTWSAQGLPAGILVSAGGIVSGTPTQAGSGKFIETVADSVGSTQSLYLAYSVFGIIPAALPNAVAFSFYSQTVAAIGGTQPYSFSGSGFPGGVSISGDGVIGGVATRQGAYQLTIQAVDATGVTTSAVLSLTVGAPLPLAVSSTLPAGIVGVFYSQPVGATGGAPPYTFTMTGGTLPPGLQLYSSPFPGVPVSITGTPGSAGQFTFAIQATDSTGATANASVTLAIATTALTLSAAPVLPLGFVGVDYPIQIEAASGGTPPYAFSLASGNLPRGLALSPDGVIGGVPSASGPYSFSVGVSDSSGTSAVASLSAVVQPFSTSLSLSAGYLVFPIVAGGIQPPPMQTVRVQSTALGTILSYSVSMSPSVPWLSISQTSGSTPGSFGIAATSQALALDPSSSPYQTAVVVTCTAPAPCQGSSQTVTVSLSVSDVPAHLTSSPDLLAFVATQTAQPVSQNLILQNVGGGSIGSISITTSVPWVNVAPISGSLSGGRKAAVAITASPAGLPAGFYRTTLLVASSAGTTTVPLTLFVTSAPSMTLSSNGAQFSFAAGGVPPAANTSFRVNVAGGSLPNAVNWTAAVVSGVGWLSTSTPVGVSSTASAGAVSFAIDPIAASVLSSGVYYGVIRVASSQVSDSPLDFQVLLNVLAPSDPATPATAPDGLVFITSSSSPPSSQAIQVFSTSPNVTSYQVSASTVDGHTWLSANPPSGVAELDTPSQSQVTVNPAGLSTGVYYGGVSYAGAGAAIRTVNVTLVVVPASPAPCSPSQIVLARVALPNNFAVTASRPAPLAVQLLNDCGTPLANNEVSAGFSNGDPPIALSLVDASTGLYSGTWYPGQPASQVAVSVVATASGLPAASIQYNGSVRPGNAPTLAPLSTLHIFAPQPTAALAPGTIVQIYGSGLSGTTAGASSVPVATSLGGVSVSIGGIPAPLFYVSPTQINAQVPFELTGESQYEIEVNSNGILSPPDTIHVSSVAPGIAVLPGGIAIAQHSDGDPVSELSPATPGESLVVYAAGLGVTSPAVATGAAAPSGPLARPVATPILMVGSEIAQVQFVGLTPGLVGLYQINMTVPLDAPNGDLALVLSQGETVSVPAILPVHNE